MRVAIIGAGAAGLSSARHVLAQGFSCDVFEMASELGGTWVYTDSLDKDEYGYPVHTVMYKDLRANLPKEVMGFPDFLVPDILNDSFLSQKDTLNFLNLYANYFKLTQLIKFNEMVIELRPFEEKWQITSLHKPTNNKTTKIYDVVMICTGHYHTPIIPTLPGEETFKGSILHSHQYRSSEPYKNQKVLVIGSGPSAFDIVLQLSTVAESVVMSHSKDKKSNVTYPKNTSKKPAVRAIKNEQVEFTDDTFCSFDAILYCTGYKYSFPFLHETCGVKVDDNEVHGLYKHIIYIERPSLCFIGLPHYVCAFQLFDIQVRFYCQYLNGSMCLPSKEIMCEDREEDIKRRQKYSESKPHLLGHHQQEYFDDLAVTANITPIPGVITKIWADVIAGLYNDVASFRKHKYRIVNDDVYVRF